MISLPLRNHVNLFPRLLLFSGSMCQPTPLAFYGGTSDPCYQLATRGSTVSTVSSVSKPGSAIVSLAGYIGDSPSTKDTAQNTTHYVQVGLTYVLENFIDSSYLLYFMFHLHLYIVSL